MTQDINKKAYSMILWYACDKITARTLRDYGSLSTRLRLVITMFLIMVLVAGDAWGQTEITDINGLKGMTATGNYILKADIDASSYTLSIDNFSGTLEGAANDKGKFYSISGLTKPLFNITGGQAPCESNQVRLSRPILTAAVSTLY